MFPPASFDSFGHGGGVVLTPALHSVRDINEYERRARHELHEAGMASVPLVLSPKHDPHPYSQSPPPHMAAYQYQQQQQPNQFSPLTPYQNQYQPQHQLQYQSSNPSSVPLSNYPPSVYDPSGADVMNDTSLLLTNRSVFSPSHPHANVTSPYAMSHDAYPFPYAVDNQPMPHLLASPASGYPYPYGHPGDASFHSLLAQNPYLVDRPEDHPPNQGELLTSSRFHAEDVDEILDHETVEQREREEAAVAALRAHVEARKRGELPEQQAAYEQQQQTPEEQQAYEQTAQQPQTIQTEAPAEAAAVSGSQIQSPRLISPSHHQSSSMPSHPSAHASRAATAQHSRTQSVQASRTHSRVPSRVASERSSPRQSPQQVADTTAKFSPVLSPRLSSEALSAAGLPPSSSSSSSGSLISRSHSNSTSSLPMDASPLIIHPVGEGMEQMSQPASPFIDRASRLRDEAVEQQIQRQLQHEAEAQYYQQQQQQQLIQEQLLKEQQQQLQAFHQHQAQPQRVLRIPSQPNSSRTHQQPSSSHFPQQSSFQPVQSSLQQQQQQQQQQMQQQQQPYDSRPYEPQHNFHSQPPHPSTVAAHPSAITPRRPDGSVPLPPVLPHYAADLSLLQEEFLYLKDKIKTLKAEHTKKSSAMRDTFEQELKNHQDRSREENEAWRNKQTKLFVEWWAMVNYRHLQDVANTALNSAQGSTGTSTPSLGSAGAAAAVAGGGKGPWLTQPPQQLFTLADGSSLQIDTNAPLLASVTGATPLSTTAAGTAANPGATPEFSVQTVSAPPTGTAAQQHQQQASVATVTTLSASLAASQAEVVALRKNLDEVIAGLTESFAKPLAGSSSPLISPSPSPAAAASAAAATVAATFTVDPAVVAAAAIALPLSSSSSASPTLSTSSPSSQPSLSLLAALQSLVQTKTVELSELQSRFDAKLEEHDAYISQLNQQHEASLEKQRNESKKELEKFLEKEKKYKAQFVFYDQTYNDLQARFDQLLSERESEKAEWMKERNRIKEEAEAQYDKYESEIALITSETNARNFAKLAAEAEKDAALANAMAERDQVTTQSLAAIEITHANELRALEAKHAETLAILEAEHVESLRLAGENAEKKHAEQLEYLHARSRSDAEELSHVQDKARETNQTAMKALRHRTGLRVMKSFLLKYSNALLSRALRTWGGRVLQLKATDEYIKGLREGLEGQSGNPNAKGVLSLLPPPGSNANVTTVALLRNALVAQKEDAAAAAAAAASASHHADPASVTRLEHESSLSRVDSSLSWRDSASSRINSADASPLLSARRDSVSSSTKSGIFPSSQVPSAHRSPYLPQSSISSLQHKESPSSAAPHHFAHQLGLEKLHALIRRIHTKTVTKRWNTWKQFTLAAKWKLSQEKVEAERKKQQAKEKQEQEDRQREKEKEDAEKARQFEARLRAATAAAANATAAAIAATSSEPVRAASAPNVAPPAPNTTTLGLSASLLTSPLPPSSRRPSAIATRVAPVAPAAGLTRSEPVQHTSPVRSASATRPQPNNRTSPPIQSYEQQTAAGRNRLGSPRSPPQPTLFHSATTINEKRMRSISSPPSKHRNNHSGEAPPPPPPSYGVTTSLGPLPPLPLSPPASQTLQHPFNPKAHLSPQKTLSPAQIARNTALQMRAYMGSPAAPSLPLASEDSSSSVPPAHAPVAAPATDDRRGSFKDREKEREEKVAHDQSFHASLLAAQELAAKFLQPDSAPPHLTPTAALVNSVHSAGLTTSGATKMFSTASNSSVASVSPPSSHRSMSSTTSSTSSFGLSTAAGVLSVNGVGGPNKNVDLGLELRHMLLLQQHELLMEHQKQLNNQSKAVAQQFQHIHPNDTSLQLSHPISSVAQPLPPPPQQPASHPTRNNSLAYPPPSPYPNLHPSGMSALGVPTHIRLQQQHTPPPPAVANIGATSMTNVGTENGGPARTSPVAHLRVMIPKSKVKEVITTQIVLPRGHRSGSTSHARSNSSSRNGTESDRSNTSGPRLYDPSQDSVRLTPQQMKTQPMVTNLSQTKAMSNKKKTTTTTTTINNPPPHAAFTTSRLKK